MCCLKWYRQRGDGGITPEEAGVLLPLKTLFIANFHGLPLLIIRDRSFFGLIKTTCLSLIPSINLGNELFSSKIDVIFWGSASFLSVYHYLVIWRELQGALEQFFISFSVIVNPQLGWPIFPDRVQ